MSPAFPKPPKRERKRLAPGRTLAAPTTPMRPFSAKRRALYDEQYLPNRERFLKEHPECGAKVRGICTRIAEDVHHMVQRSLAPGAANLLDESLWLACCRACHSFISDDSARAREMGFEVAP